MPYRNVSEVEHRRPLSPHLQVYRPMLTMMMSIVHRITGAALFAGALLLVYYLVAAANGPASFVTAASARSSADHSFRLQLGAVPSSARWRPPCDLGHGYGMDHPVREYLAQATAVGGIALTVIVWALAYMMG